MASVHYRLRDINPAVAAARARCFANCSDVSVSHGDIFAEHDGELPVGQAVIVETGDPRFPWLISAPTMRVPMDVSGSVNAYLAFRAVIRAVRIHNQTGPGLIRSVLCPGLGTAIGRMDPQACAQQMYSAYRISHAGQSLAFDDLMAACRDHVDLVHGATRRGSAPKAEA